MKKSRTFSFASVFFLLGLNATAFGQLSSEVQGGKVTLLKKNETPQPKYINHSATEKKFISACDAGNFTAVKECDSAGVNINLYDQYGNTALILASMNGHTKIVDYLLSKKAAVNTQNIYGYTALILAADRGHLDNVNLLIANKANLNIEAETGGVTALLRSVINNKYPIAEVLLKAGANPNIKTGNPATPTVLKNAYDKEMKKLLKLYKAK